MFRSVMASARALVLLDNVADEAQVRPLLSASPRCMTIITSRSVLSGLEGAKGLILDVPPANEALQLLRHVIGDRRADAEEPAARQEVRLCAGLPLAIRVAGARLAARPAWPVEELARRLGDDHCRLAELAAGDLEVRAAFGPSYSALDPPARRVFRQLGLIGSADFRIEQAAAIADLSAAAVQSILERLADLSLVQPIAPGRYRMHDLLRLYAAECGREEQADEVRAQPHADKSASSAAYDRPAGLRSRRLLGDLRPRCRFAVLPPA
jgi:NB-ARC domain